MSEPANLDLTFLFEIRQDVLTMRERGLNDIQIGWIIYAIRAAAIHEERRRVEELARRNTPSFAVSGFQIADQIKREIQS